MKKDCIVLIGMAGVGKSTTGAALARALGYQFTDLDDYIQGKEHRTLQEIIDSRGESGLMELEKQSMYEIKLKRRVIAPGGSIVYHKDLMEYLRQHGTIVYLEDTFENVRKRIKNLDTRGIVGLKKKSLRAIFEERQPFYVQYADITVKTQGKSLEQVVQEILNRLITI